MLSNALTSCLLVTVFTDHPTVYNCTHLIRSKTSLNMSFRHTSNTLNYINNYAFTKRVLMDLKISYEGVKDTPQPNQSQLIQQPVGNT